MNHTSKPRNHSSLRRVESQQDSSKSNSHSNTVTPSTDIKRDNWAETATAPEHASLPRKPPTINVILFGETGVGISSVINLIAQRDVARVSPDASCCTTQFIRYDISFDNMDFAIFDTIGFGGLEVGSNSCSNATENAYELILNLSVAGGIHLLLFCMRGGRITRTTLSSYQLFCETLCEKKVSTALVFTGLEREVEMENWWKRNETHITHYGIKGDGHACITVVRNDTLKEDLKYTESQRKIRELLKTCGPRNEAFSMEPSTWFALAKNLMGDLIGRKTVLRVLMQCCKSDPNIAGRITKMLEGIDLRGRFEHPSLDTKTRLSLCEFLCTMGRTEDTVECFLVMTSESESETKLRDKHLKWAPVQFKRLACERLVDLGDAAASAQGHEEAISHYTTALLLRLSSKQDILIKRGKAYMETGRSEQALDDANRVINLDPCSPWGYEIKHAALHKARDYDNAVDVFKTMLSKMEQSPDPDIRRHRNKYKTPSRTRTRIQRIVKRTLQDSPRVLINTTTGHLCNRAEQASAFESLPIFNELVSSMTTRIDRARIKREVQQYFKYVMLSHRWEENEPSFEQVVHITVYDLRPSPTHDKLQMFCKIVREAGFNWAWSDTCCIDTGKHDVHQEALVAMFKWYRGSALMIVFLRGVGSASQFGALAGSIWNTRGWTLQEYIAAKFIRFYTEDWTPYLNLQLLNHKESPEVIAEMEQATGVSSEQLVALHPGLTSIREKLRLASTRETERVEDAAYSLLGILSVTGIPVIYGEGDAPLGRLSSHVLAGSGDVSILAWTGESGSFNSCLPARITVFNEPPTSHLPLPIPDDEMERIVTAPSTRPFGLNVALSLVTASYTPLNLKVALRLYDCLKELPPPWFAASRMKLPCIAVQLPPLSPSRARSGWVFCADTVPFGTVEIKTRQNLSRMGPLYLVHPWLDSLLEQVHTQSGSFVEDVTPPPSPSTEDEEGSDSDFDEEASLGDPKPEPSSYPAPVNREMQARRLAARLRQPFGALLVAPVATGRRGSDYRRVAADSLITVAFQSHVSLSDILDNVRTLDVL